MPRVFKMLFQLYLALLWAGASSFVALDAFVLIDFHDITLGSINE